MLLQFNTLKQQTANPSLWDDQHKAQTLLKKQSDIQKTLDTFSALENQLAAVSEYASEQDLQEEVKATISTLQQQITTLSMKTLFSGEADSLYCFLEIHAGAGGTESHDWAEMLYRMYGRFCQNKGFTVEIIDELYGEEAGIKSITIKISGHEAFGWLKTESGVHRLVRISPFNAAGKRQTSFASVWVFPVVDENINIEIAESDLRIDTYRSSGAGGQHVNTTDSAVRITHMPTKTVVQCQTNRSQHKNKAEALSMLKSKLYQLKLKEKEQKLNAENAKKTDNSWGNQIRSYVLHPYHMVKDHRSDYETSNTNAILDGDLEDVILTNLRYLKK